MSGAVHGSEAQTDLMIVHSVSVNSKCGLGIMVCDRRTISTTVEAVKRNIYNCRDRAWKAVRTSRRNPKPETRSKFEFPKLLQDFLGPGDLVSPVFRPVCQDADGCALILRGALSPLLKRMMYSVWERE